MNTRDILATRTGFQNHECGLAKGLGGKRGAGVTGFGVPGYGVRGPGVWGSGVWKTRGLVENTGSGGKHGVKWKTRGLPGKHKVALFFGKI